MPQNQQGDFNEGADNDDHAIMRSGLDRHSDAGHVYFKCVSTEGMRVLKVSEGVGRCARGNVSDGSCRMWEARSVDRMRKSARLKGTCRDNIGTN
jgi:hypothetical protein